MKLSKLISVILALCMLLSCTCFASGEASGGGRSAKLLRVSGSTLTTSDSDSWTLEGDVPVDAQSIAGLKFVAGSVNDTFLSVSASEHVDPLADGFTAVVGNEEELYAEGYPLDYTWISQIDWDETSDTYGELSAVTTEGNALLDELLDNASYARD